MTTLKVETNPDKYYIGINFGHDFTYVSCAPSFDGKPTTLLFRLPNTFCKNQDDEFELIEGPYIAECKGTISNLSSEEKNALKIFSKLVFNKILKENSYLRFNPTTGESNFEICITYPLAWERINPNCPTEYKLFFRDEAGLTPTTICISEQAATHFALTQYKHIECLEDEIDSLINIGAYCTDFTTFHNSNIVNELSSGHNIGFHCIVDKIIEYGFTKSDNCKENVANIQEVDKLRKQYGLSNAIYFIEQEVYRELNRHPITTISHRTTCFDFYVDVPYRCLIPDSSSRIPRCKIAFSVLLENSEIMRLISDYVQDIQTAVKGDISRIVSYGIKPTRIFLTGIGSNYGFVSNIIKNLFPEEQIYISWDLLPIITVTSDQCIRIPERMVLSDGAALYAQSHSKKVLTKRL